MMAEYARLYSREFTLVNIQVWNRVECLTKKVWTSKEQPFQPYNVFERCDGTINVYYSKEGLAWVREELLRLAREEGFLLRVEQEVREAISPMREAYEKRAALDHEALLRFLDQFEVAYRWLEAIWQLMELTEEPDIDWSPLLRVREETASFAPDTDHVFRNSLKHCFSSVSEYCDVLAEEEIRSGKLPPIAVLQNRQKGFCYAEGKLLPDRKALERLGVRIEEENLREEVKGTVAYKGVVRGTARIVKGFSDADKVEVGDILIASQTMTDIMDAMGRAVAFVTDEGGTLSHAAIVAREMQKPCVIGTRNATSIFKDGDLVEVDANKGTVRKV